MKKRSLKQIFYDALKLFLNDIKAAKWAILCVIAYFAFLKNFAYSTCPAVMITGFPCPGCGMSRAAFRVLCLDFAGAFRIHPFIYPIIGLFLLFCIQRYIMLSKDMKLTRNCMVIIAVGMVIFYVWRMYKYFPGDPPMSYYYGNLLRKIFLPEKIVRIMYLPIIRNKQSINIIQLINKFTTLFIT